MSRNILSIDDIPSSIRLSWCDHYQQQRDIASSMTSTLNVPIDVCHIVPLCQQIDIKECGHNIYPSQIAHVNHILRFLYSDPNLDAPVIFDQYQVIMAAINARMCINCINLIFSSVHFSDIFKLHLYCLPNKNDDTILHFRDRLYSNLLRHPKSHRIFAKSFPIHKEQFALSISMEDNGYLAGLDFYCVCRTMMEYLNDKTLDQEQRTQFIQTLCRSVNHWSKYQLLFFINHLYWDLTKTIEECRNRTKRFRSDIKGNLFKLLPTAFAERCHELVCWRAAKYGQKYGTKILRENIQDHEVLPDIYHSARSTNTKRKRNVKRYVLVCVVECGRTGCSKTGGHIEKGKNRMKVCRQCKMTYYCSRSCQKRDWQDRHRQRCLILREYYGCAM